MHRYEPKSDPKLPTTKIMGAYTNAKYVWCVTGTPMSQSLGQLEWQARMLGHWSSGLHLDQLLTAEAPKYDPPKPGVDSHRSKSNEELCRELQRLMIRHTKAQRLASGEAALALPDSQCETVWLTMSAQEKTLCAPHGRAEHPRPLPAKLPQRAQRRVPFVCWAPSAERTFLRAPPRAPCIHTASPALPSQSQVRAARLR